MRKLMVALALAGGLAGMASAAPVLTEKIAAHVVPVLTAEQKAFLALSAVERRAVFTNAAYRTKLADSVRKMNWREPTDGETSRWRRLPGIPNMRDLGGLKGLDGRTVACGRIFRSGAFNDNAKSELVDDADHPGEKKRVWKGRGKDRLTDDARKFQIENFGIRTDLDLRTDGECNEMTASPLGPQVTWVHSPSQSYGSFFSDVGKASTKRNFALFLDERNYPIAVHCIAGADRTGSLIYLLEALLGVSDDDLLLDWELTAFYSSTVNFAHAPRYDKLVAGFAKFPGRTTRERAESYVRSLGFTDEDIAGFRKIMLRPLSVGACSEPIRAVQLDVVLTFDDGVKDHLLVAAPELEKRGWRGIFCVVPEWIGKDGKKLTWDDVRELKRRGHEIANHTLSHADLGKLAREGNLDEVRRQIAAGRDAIAKETGETPKVLCIPFGSIEPDVYRIAAEEGQVVLPVDRANFGEGSGSVSARIDGHLVRADLYCDILSHGVRKSGGGWNPFATEAEFRTHLDRIAAYGDRIRVVTGPAAHAAMDRHRRAAAGR